MRRRLARGMAVGVAAATLVMSPAAAGTVDVSGSFTQNSFAITSSRTVGNVTFFTFEETDTLTGSFSGETLIIGECVAFASGITQCKADEYFTGTVNGAAGTMHFADLIRVDTTTGAIEGQFVVVGATGDLTNLHGRGTFSGAGTTGTYSAKLATGP